MAEVEGASQYDDLAKLLSDAKLAFRNQFHCDPTVASCAPGRVNLIGEHTDYNDGFVFPMALPMVTVVVGSKTDTGKCHIVTTSKDADSPLYTEFEAPSTGATLAPGAPKWANYVKGVVACFKGGVPSFDAAIVTSVPLGGGLSSSASLEVATYTFLETLTGIKADLKDKALACQEAEHTFAGMPCGIMDQFISTMGQEGRALLLDCRAMGGRLVPIIDPDLIVLITNSNVKHELSSSQYPIRRQQCEEAAKIIGVDKLRDVSLNQLLEFKGKMDPVVYARAHHVVTENKRCEDGASALEAGDYVTFGKLMVDSHNSLRDDYEVSCTELDALVEFATQVDGVYGSRMTGGGFGGCTVSLVKAQCVQNVINHIKDHYQGKPTFYICKPSSGAQELALN